METTEYIYRDIMGQVQGVKTRRDTQEGKEIYWKKPLKTTVPYRLDEIANTKTVFLLEGEKCVDFFHQKTKWKATCCPNGSNSDATCAMWLKEVGVERVILIPDNDETGHKYVTDFAYQLLKLGIVSKIIKLTGLFPSEDFYEWITERNGSVDKLKELIKEAKSIELPYQKLKKLSEVKDENVSWLWENRIPLSYLSILYGYPGCGKSYISSAIACAGSIGKGLPQQEKFEPFDSLFLLGEDSSSVLKTRIETFEEHDMDKISVFDEGSVQFTPEGIDEIKAMIRETKASLCVIDPLNAFFAGYQNVNSDNEVREVLSDILKEARKYNCALLCISHLNKSSQITDAIYRLSGSTGLSGLARSMMLAGRVTEEIDSREKFHSNVLVHVKSNLSNLQHSLGYKIYSDGSFNWGTQVSYNENDIIIGESNAKRN